MLDRRSGQERRSTNRYPIELDVEWQSTGERMPGTVSDISLDGCFILSSGEVENGQRIRMFVPLDDGMRVEFGGVVANYVYEIGFGVRFDQLSTAQRELLIGIVKDATKG